MNRFLSGLLITAVAVGPASALPSWKATPSGTRLGGPPRYDLRKEAVLEGSVSTVVTKPGPGWPAGTHLMLNTASGKVGAHLGNYAMRGPNAISLAAGDRVKVTGVMTTIRGRSIFLVRRLQVGLNIYQIRNEHGFLVRSGPADWTGRRTASRGGRP
jgi:hypothetical protein